MATPAHSDPPRTVAGNRIDARLAQGIVNQAIREAEKRMELKPLRSPQGLGNETARRRFAARMVKALGPCMVGSTVSRQCTRIALSSLVTFDLAKNWNGLGVTTEIWNLDPKHPRNVYPGDFFAESVKIEAFVDKHVLIRLAQRRGDTTLDGFMAALQPVWNWCQLANMTRMSGVFHIPIAEGLICCERKRIENAGPGLPDRPITRILTYLDLRAMNQFNRDAWDRLTGAGVLEMRPRFPRFSDPSPEEEAILAAMRQEGAAWEGRRDVAIQRVKTRAPAVTETADLQI
ncbi:hypothetical protein LAZ40_06955 [Cereibacter sphaeroides]|uniref:hypothetical protein n=1 Tax=Cereibacter sphaeroides TaxID=1063 RepID=UPI001F1685D3|nr:hypothetical protein [Cereibacter sphaeroides]MCE6958786.1 hypothetical protein [Cereibacter sphaeroides]MCE6973340.1 hypothetical protein [Cereibacter sphaeroides]